MPDPHVIADPLVPEGTAIFMDVRELRYLQRCGFSLEGALEVMAHEKKLVIITGIGETKCLNSPVT